MGLSDTAGPSRRRLLVRWGSIILLFLAAAIAGGVIWGWPTTAWDNSDRVLSTWGLTLGAAVCVVLWLVFLSGLRWFVSLTAVAVVALAVPATVRVRGFTGDMIPVVEWRWQPSADDLIESDRARQANSGPVAAVQLSDDPADSFPEFRGVHRDGVVIGPSLSRDWTKQPPVELWREPVGRGYSGIAVSGNIIVTLEQRRDNEVVVGYDAASGKERWTYSYPAHFSESLGGEGPRATPTIAGSQVFSLGASGVLVCLDARTGTRQWVTNILEPDNANLRWGMSGSPLVVGNQVVVAPGRQTANGTVGTLTGYDRATGAKLWSAGRAMAGYSSPMRAKLAGKEQIVLFDGEGVAGYGIDTHQELWRFPWLTMQHVNVAEPLVLDGDKLFISSGYNVGCALLKIAPGEPVKELWRNRALRSKFNNPVTRNGFIYGLDDGVLVCLDAKTGERRWRGGHDVGHGQLLLAGDLLVVLTEKGQLALVDATPEAYREQGRVDALKGKTWNCPALAAGKLYVRNDREMACYDLRSRQ